MNYLFPAGICLHQFPPSGGRSQSHRRSVRIWIRSSYSQCWMGQVSNCQFGQLSVKYIIYSCCQPYLILSADRRTTEESIRIYVRMTPDFIVVKHGRYLNKENHNCYHIFLLFLFAYLLHFQAAFILTEPSLKIALRLYSHWLEARPCPVELQATTENRSKVECFIYRSFDVNAGRAHWILITQATLLKVRDVLVY